MATCGAIQRGVQTSASATTIYASWTTGSTSDTVLQCGASPSTFTINAADAGTQTSVTAHTGIIAGLTPNTRYYCRAMSGGAEVARWEIATQALPATTPITGCSFGTASKVTTPAIQGDTFHNTIANDGLTYVTADDTQGFNNAYPTGGPPMMIGRFTSEVPALAGVNVNRMVGAQVGVPSDKLSGLLAIDGALYGAKALQDNGTGTPYKQTGGQIIKSLDYGATWANFQAPNTPVSSGNAPSTTPTNASMWGANGSQAMACPSFIMHGPDDGTLGYRVNNADAYVYVISNEGVWQNGSMLYLSRVPRAKLPNLSGSDYQYWTGGDGNLNANWSSTFINAVSLLGTQLGKIGYTTCQYLPALNRYVMLTWYYPNATATSASVWVAYEAQYPWGPWTTINGAGDSWSPQGWYNPSILQRSALGNVTAFGLTLLFAGDYVGSGNGQYYNLNTRKMTLQT